MSDCLWLPPVNSFDGHVDCFDNRARLQFYVAGISRQDMALSFSPMVTHDHIHSQDDPQDLAAQAAVNYRAAQAAIQGRNTRKAERREWAVAGIAILCLTVCLWALVAAHAAYLWP
jgi:hypothetical protein